MEWHFQAAQNHDLISLSYETLLHGGRETALRVLRELDLPVDVEIVEDLLDRSSFRFRTGRERGQEDKRRFDRKGVSGDWRNHFAEDDKRMFKDLAGDILIQLGYEKDNSW